MNKIRISSYIVSSLFALIILILSTIPTDNSTTGVFFFKGMDKVIHAIMYCVFVILLLRDFLRQNPFKLKNAILLALVAVFYSVMMELIQHYFIPSRSGEILDIFANITGIFAGILFVYLTKKERARD